MKLTTISRLSQLSDTSGALYIYGTGQGGQIVYDTLPGPVQARVTGFLDSFQSGEFLGLPVYLASDHLPRLSGELHVIVASMHEKAILEIIEAHGPHDAQAYTLWDFIEAGTYCYTPQEEQDAKAKCDEIIGYLEDDRSKSMFQRLFETRLRAPGGDTPYNEDAENKFRSHFIESIGGEEFLALVGGNIYLDNVNLGAVQVIVEGGMYDGYNAYQFLPVLGAEGKLYSFEPNIRELLAAYGDDPRKGLYLNFLAHHPLVEIVDKGLMNTDCELRFGGQGGIDMQRVSETGQRIVQCTSIDRFAKERNLERLDMIKLDIEGAEPECLAGATVSLEKFRPQLAISIYHTRDQFLTIPLGLMKTLKDYAFYLGHYCPLPRYDTVLYAVPRELV